MLGAAQALISRSRTVHGPAERCGPFFTLNMGSTLYSHEERGGYHQKMQEYVENGARLGWLIDPNERVVYVYRPGETVERLNDPREISGGPVLAGFVLRLRDIW